MKYAVCVLAHNKPILLDRIVRKISNHNVEVFVHLDSKCNISDYSHIKGVTFIQNRLNVYWGGRSMVKAMFNLIEYVVNKTDCDYLLFISGQDFPIMKPEKYDDFIDCSKNYIEYEKLPREDWYMGGIKRISNYYIFNTSSSLFSRIFVKLQRLIKVTRKYWKNEFLIYGGSQWININRTAAEYILHNWSKYYKFFRYSHIPDELLFQTILLNSPFKDTIVNTNLRFLIFENSKPNPVYLNESHYESIISSKALYCRKIFDENSLEKLDSFCKKNGL